MAADFRTATPDVVPVMDSDVLAAIGLIRADPGLKPRDAVHAGVRLSHGIRRICSMDKEFDRIAEIERVVPRELVVG